MRSFPKIVLCASWSLLACPARDAKPDQSSAPGASPTDAAWAVDAGREAAVIDASAGQTLCATGPECAAQGLHASDQRQHARARLLLERACGLDDALGCKLLSLDFDHDRGPGLAADAARSQQLMHKACDLGGLESCRMPAVGYLYGNRPGVTADAERAVALFEKACEAGDAASCEGLANCYADGTGASKDRKLAKQYRKRAAELGYVGE